MPDRGSGPYGLATAWLIRFSLGAQDTGERKRLSTAFVLLPRSLPQALTAWLKRLCTGTIGSSSCPLLAQSRHRTRTDPCPLPGVKQTLIGRRRKATAVNQRKSRPLHRDEREAGYNGAVDCCSRIAALRTYYGHTGKQCGDDTEHYFKWDHNHPHAGTIRKN